MRDWPVPEPGQGEVRLRVKCCGVCHTDLHTIEGDLVAPTLPLIPGHQVVGLVDGAGPGASKFRRGDRVGVPWLFQTCGQCGFCASDRENLCDRARFTGLDVNGGYAEWMIVGEDYAYELPARFSDIEVAPLLCAGIIGYRSLRLSEIRPGGRLGLYGFGASAHITIQIARHWHWQCEVYVFTRSEEHRRHATERGAAWVGGSEDEPPGRWNSTRPWSLLRRAASCSTCCGSSREVEPSRWPESTCRRSRACPMTFSTRNEPCEAWPTARVRTLGNSWPWQVRSRFKPTWKLSAWRRPTGPW